MKKILPDGTCGCGQPTTLCSLNQSALKGPKSPNGTILCFEQKM